jgi:hypothetical protein
MYWYLLCWYATNRIYHTNEVPVSPINDFYSALRVQTIVKLSWSLQFVLPINVPVQPCNRLHFSQIFYFLAADR